MIRFHNVSKKYGRKVAIADVNIELIQGELIGLVGANGAGKTTIIKLACSLLKPTAGEIFFRDKPYDLNNYELKKNLGYLKETANLYEKLTVLDNIKIFMKARNLKADQTAFKKIFDDWQIDKIRNEQVKNLSKGQKQKVNLLCAIIHEPVLLILDEPFSGIDVENKEFIRDKIRKISNANTIVLISSHDIDEIERLATRLYLIHQGRIITEGSPETVKNRILGLVYRFRISAEPSDWNSIMPFCKEINSDRGNGTVDIKISDESHVNRILQYFIDNNIIVYSLGKLNLEDSLLHYIKSAGKEKE